MDNIKESKEYKLAKEWEMAVNSFSFNPKRFAAAIPDMHPTLQQSLYRLIKECIVVMADETRRYDDRNRASHEEAKHIMEYLNENGRNRKHRKYNLTASHIPAVWWNPTRAKNCRSVRPSCSMPFIRVVSRTRTKVLPARKPNSFTTRYFSSQTKTPSICRTRS